MAGPSEERFKEVGIEERGWFRLPQDRARWRGCCKSGLERVTRRRLEEDDSRRRAGLACILTQEHRRTSYQPEQ